MTRLLVTRYLGRYGLPHATKEKNYVAVSVERKVLPLHVLHYRGTAFLVSLSRPLLSHCQLLRGQRRSFQRLCPRSSSPVSQYLLFLLLTTAIMSSFVKYEPISPARSADAATSNSDDEGYPLPKNTSFFVKQRLRMIPGLAIFGTLVALSLYTWAVLYYAREIIYKPFCPRLTAPDTIHVWASQLFRGAPIVLAYTNKLIPGQGGVSSSTCESSDARQESPILRRPQSRCGRQLDRVALR